MPLPPPHNLSQQSALSLPSSPLPSLESMKSTAHITHLGLNTPPRKFIQEKKKERKQNHGQEKLRQYNCQPHNSLHNQRCYYIACFFFILGIVIFAILIKFVSQNEQFSTGVCVYIYIYRERERERERDFQFPEVLSFCANQEIIKKNFHVW